MQQIKLNESILNDPKYDYLYTVEVVNDAVLNGVPFRRAYQEVGKAVEDGTYRFDGELKHTHEGSLGNLCNEQIQAKIDLIWNEFQFEKANTTIEQLLS